MYTNNFKENQSTLRNHYDNRIYDNSITEYVQDFKIIIPSESINITKKTTPKLTLQALHWNVIKDNAHFIEIRKFTNNHFTSTYIWLRILTLTVILGIVFKRRSTILDLQMHPTQNFVPAVPSLWPALHSRRGRVTDPAPLDMPPAKPPRFAL